VSKSKLPGHEWRKSSYSSATGQCVEVAALSDLVAARDSKDPAGTALTFAAKDWQAFITSLRAGWFPLGS
jgi:hypothetical protein